MVDAGGDKVGKVVQIIGPVVDVEFEGGEPQFDRDSPFLLLGEAVGVGSREGADESCLAVVDVTGRTEHETRCALGGDGGGRRHAAEAQRGPMAARPM